MTCLRCQHGTAKRFGTYGRLRIQRFSCKSCKATFTQPRQRPLGRHYIQTEKAAQIVSLHTEGMSVRAVSRFPLARKSRNPYPSHSGNPNPRYISTSHVERANLSVRTHLRRFTRLSLGFSKSLEHLKAAVDLYMAFFNLCRVNQLLRVTPAMQAGIADHIWTIQELLEAE